MAQSQLSATDAALRERLHELSVHIPCGRLRGPVHRVSRRFPDQQVWWQSCRDEDSPENWEDCDVSHKYDLCVICFRATAGGVSRWSWLACENCREVNDARASSLGVRPFALGRHSLMNGIGVGRQGSVVVRERHVAALVAFSRGDGRLAEWRSHEYRRLAARFDPLADVPLRVWQQEWPPSRAASKEAFASLLAG